MVQHNLFLEYILSTKPIPGIFFCQSVNLVFSEQKNNFRNKIIDSSSLLPNFYPVSLQHSNFQHAFTIRVRNSVNPDQMASSGAS